MMIKEYVLRNEFLEAKFINLGATITSLVHLETNINVIVGHNNLNTYKENNSGHMNSVIGRHSGRITDFLLGGKVFKPTRAEGELFQLHGGVDGIETKFFEAELGSDYIKFYTTSPDGEGGYPGNIKLSITYKLLGTEIQLHYDAVSDKKTLLSLTNHAYFNLNGDPSVNILNHDLYINADRFLLLDKNLIPINAAKVDQTPLDFRIAKNIGKDIKKPFEQLEIAGGFDHPYLVNKTSDINHVAYLKSPLTNLVLNVYSTEDAVVFYAGNMMDSNQVLKNGVVGYKNAALCLESQGIPNSPNIKEFKSKNIYAANKRYSQITIWKLTKEV